MTKAQAYAKPSSPVSETQDALNPQRSQNQVSKSKIKLITRAKVPIFLPTTHITPTPYLDS